MNKGAGIRFYILSLLSLIILQAGGKEGAVSHGGGSFAVCKEGNKAELPPGYYPVDYVLCYRNNRKAMENFADFVDPNLKILDRLWETLPSLAISFQKFLKNFDEGMQEKQNDESETWWRPSIDGLNQSPGSDSFEKLPEGCEEIVRTIERVFIPDRPAAGYMDRTQFIYWPDLVKPSEDNLKNPTWIRNHSWMLVHEWLRDFTQDAHIVKDANEYFHSKEFFDTHASGLRRPEIRVERLRLGTFMYLRSYEMYLQKTRWIHARATEIWNAIQKLKDQRRIEGNAERETRKTYVTSFEGVMPSEIAATMIAQLEISEFQNNFEVQKYIDKVLNIYIKAAYRRDLALQEDFRLGTHEFNDQDDPKEGYPTAEDIPQDELALIRSLNYGVNGDYDLDLRTWIDNASKEKFDDVGPEFGNKGKPNEHWLQVALIKKAIGTKAPPADVYWEPVDIKNFKLERINPRNR